MKKNKHQFRQGDVLIERVKRTKVSGKNAKSDGRTILAHGEATGHAHEIFEADTELIEPDAPDQRGMSALLLKLGRDAELKHQEHAPIPLRRGQYRVTRQREYFPEAIRNVAD